MRLADADSKTETASLTTGRGAPAAAPMARAQQKKPTTKQKGARPTTDVGYSLPEQVTDR